MLRFWLGFLAVVLVGGCGTATQVESWISGETKRPIRHLLVIAVVPDEPGRVIFEDKLVKALARAGVEVMPSYEVATVSHWRDHEALRFLVRRLGVDSVLIVTLKGVEEREIRHPPRSYRVPRTYGWGYYGYYHTVWEEVHQPGYTVRQTVVRLETNLYDAESEKLLWSARSATIDPKSALDAMDSFIGALIDDLQDKGLLP
ncbi:hypothetical protein MIN45_P1262 [Methylomarinovum tepidoasis]|uniref:Lipoprotein n=1 Tax=Methylomarinovum tepidoasis TaxID=2840183 RepID=A0AAU9CAC8_9GAMM|nr:hypothetical protein [Methylomarinovum sp. IN45]BCX88892.1 hypothetical protein MIN45_P1262 [Methylomarinovum sp. IN45]